MEQQRPHEQNLHPGSPDPSAHPESIPVVECAEQEATEPERATTPPPEQESKHPRIHDAEITHPRVGLHPKPELATKQETVGLIADAFWKYAIGPQIMGDQARKEHPEDNQ